MSNELFELITILSICFVALISVVIVELPSNKRSGTDNQNTSRGYDFSAEDLEREHLKHAGEGIGYMEYTDNHHNSSEGL